MSIEEIEIMFKSIAEKAKEKIKDELRINKVFQFHVENVGDFYIEIKQGEIYFLKGLHPNPTSILSTDIETLKKILKKELNAMTAFLRGKIKISKNVIETVTLRKIIESA